MPKFDDLSRSPLIAVIELSRASWLVGGIVPGIEREPLKKLNPDPDALLRLLHRWRDEAAMKAQVPEGVRLHPAI